MIPSTNAPSTSSEPTRALILAVHPQLRSDAEHRASCRELEALATTLGFDVVEVRSHKVTKPSLDTYVGAGSLGQLAQDLGGPGLDLATSETWSRRDDPPVDLVLVNDALSPKLQRKLQRALDVEVLDRSAVILEIFERRARTRQARLEVEIARLRYELPRLRDDTTKRGREGGGGRGERGDKLVALGKQRIRVRINALETELASLQVADQMRRSRRQEVFQVALVGYTNAGKSSLMRTLTGNDVLVEDQLFATLDTTVRQLSPPASPSIVVADTVGFIQDLPHELVASFRSTLAEARDADLVLLTLDASDPTWPRHLEVTSTTLEELAVEPFRIRVVFNKCDRLDDDARDTLRAAHPDAFLTSAHDPDEYGDLHGEILGVQRRSLCEELIGLSHAHGGLRAEIYGRARVLEERYETWGSVLRVLGRPEDLERWNGMLDVDVSGAAEVLEVLWNHGFELDATADSSTEGVLVARDVANEPWEIEVCTTRAQRDAWRRVERIWRELSGSLGLMRPTRQVINAGLRLGLPKYGRALKGRSGVELGSIARVLARLWSLPTVQVAETGVRHATMDGVRQDRIRAFNAVSSALDVEPSRLGRWYAWLEDSTVWPRESVVVHGSWTAAHTRVGARGAVVSLDGWETVHVGDPGEDLATLSSWLGEDIRLLDALEKCGAPVWDGALVHLEYVSSFECVLRAAEILDEGAPDALARAQAVMDSSA